MYPKPKRETKKTHMQNQKKKKYQFPKLSVGFVPYGPFTTPQSLLPFPTHPSFPSLPLSSLYVSLYPCASFPLCINSASPSFCYSCVLSLYLLYIQWLKAKNSDIKHFKTSLNHTLVITPFWWGLPKKKVHESSPLTPHSAMPPH